MTTMSEPLTVEALRVALDGLPGQMRIVTPDFLPTYFVVSHVERDTFVGIVTDVDPEDERHPPEPTRDDYDGLTEHYYPELGDF